MAITNLDWKQWRLICGLSQEEVTEMMNRRGHSWHQSTVYKIEKGLRNLSFNEGLHLCAIYDVDIDQEIRGCNG